MGALRLHIGIALFCSVWINKEENMKKIFSSLLVFIWTPFKAFKKANKDNFVWGLVFGALFSFVVNIFTIQIQERITKQRILEAVEYEIYSNLSQAKFINDASTKTIVNKELPNPFYTYQQYSRDLWVQSTEPLQYIAQLPADIQAQIQVYYTVTIPRLNEMIGKTEKYSESALVDCYPLDGFNNKSTEEKCRYVYYQLMDNTAKTAEQVANDSFKVLDKFHPTQDRLNSPLLRLLMGSDAVRVLSRK